MHNNKHNEPLGRRHWIGSPNAISIVALELIETLDGLRGIHVLLLQDDLAAVLCGQLYSKSGLPLYSLSVQRKSLLMETPYVVYHSVSVS